MSRTPDMHVGGESDGRVLPTKRPNNGGQPLAEGVEGRRPTKENIEQTTAPRTQSRIQRDERLARCAGSRTQGQTDTVHRATSPCDGGAALGQFPRAQAGRCAWRGRRDVEGIRDGPRRAAAGSTQPRAPSGRIVRSLPREPTSPRPMDGSVLWALPPWRTRSFSTPSSWS